MRRIIIPMPLTQEKTLMLLKVIFSPLLPLSLRVYRAIIAKVLKFCAISSCFFMCGIAVSIKINSNWCPKGNERHKSKSTKQTSKAISKKWKQRSGLGNDVLLETSRDFSVSMSACPCVGKACAGPASIPGLFIGRNAL